MTQADIGLIGLGVMGANLALNIADNGYKVAVFNRTPEKTTAFMENAAHLKDQFIACYSLEELVKAIKAPRPIIMMVKAGEAIDQQIEALKPFLSESDILIDAGNSDYHDSNRRYRELADTPFTFVGMGVSGGAEGARHGPSIMVGASEAAYTRIQPILDAISAKHDGEPCSALMGPEGAGHFVKTLHNGIEYADMQMIAEVHEVLTKCLGLSIAEQADVFKKWNEGPLASYLIEITANVMGVIDEDSGKPILEVILDTAGQKGTGRWSAVEAHALGVPATGIDAAVASRCISANRALRQEIAEIYPNNEVPQSWEDKQAGIDACERALIAGKIAAYAEGFAVLAAGGTENGWDLPMGTIARIWRQGCIIRSRFLDEIASAYDENPELPSLYLAPTIAERMKDAAPGLRETLSKAILSGIPMPGLAAAMGSFDMMRQKRTAAYVIQGQRDFFGQHGFERTDKAGSGFHGPWPAGGA
ncbi:NADP-dependent phosphogluconate dehydrogenase [Pseudovibrio sp. SPO723]|uniref:NADP-dependent phosphogluconate dehydrogenase n=1 Tax=Nesiotobacter zosterae TaxID=392721 RepID=UPI0029C416CE|nr:NADP-dependent phosphogluconate dehydrogenase [Pseudovibrio sp. SPO723]MDX5591996.1 NADP-dependent phosphogluconate dehydrogenase [Pseudovibrio sp. SPO723]